MATLAVELGSTLHQEALGDFILIRTDQVDVGERLRPVDPIWAEALGRMMLRDGQDTPILVCRLPGRNRWLLVAGGHRHAGAIDAGIDYLRAEVVSADRDDRRLREARENLMRSDLSPVDRAAHVAEAVAILKRRAGIDPAVDGRVGSVAARWQKALKAEAADTTATLAVVYDFTDAVASDLGFSGRTVERNLMLYKRLSPSVVERLRSARHPSFTNSTHLASLAKLDEHAQASVVSLLLEPGASLNYDQPKTIGDAIAHPLGPKPAAKKPDAETKRLSAFIGAFQRMSLAEKKGALAQLAGQLPSGMRIVEGDADLTTTIGVVHDLLSDGLDPDYILGSLERDYGAKVQFRSGTVELKLARVTATCTAGGSALLTAWLNAAERRLAQAEALGLRISKGDEA